MHRSLATALVLTTCAWAGATSAQTAGTLDDTADTAWPTLVLPGELTGPLTTGLGADIDVDAGQNSGSVTTEETWEVPYSVPGEETLEPGTN